MYIYNTNIYSFILWLLEDSISGKPKRFRAGTDPGYSGALSLYIYISYIYSGYLYIGYIHTYLQFLTVWGHRPLQTGTIWSPASAPGCSDVSISLSLYIYKYHVSTGYIYIYILYIYTFRLWLFEDTVRRKPKRLGTKLLPQAVVLSLSLYIHILYM